MNKIIILAAVILFAAVNLSAQEVEVPAAQNFDETAIILDDANPAAALPETDGGRFFTTWDFVKVILILVAVILVVYAVFYALKKAGGSKYQSADLIRLLGSQSLTQNGSVHLIEVGAKYYLLGCGDASVTHLADIDDKETVDEIMLKNPPETGRKKSFSDFFNLKIGKNSTGSNDLPEKIRNNNKFMQDQAERLKKM